MWTENVLCYLGYLAPPSLGPNLFKSSPCFHALTIIKLGLVGLVMVLSEKAYRTSPSIIRHFKIICGVLNKIIRPVYNSKYYIT